MVICTEGVLNFVGLKDAKCVIRCSDLSDNYLTIQLLVLDLIETFVTNPPPSALAGKSFHVTDTVKEQGDANAGFSNTRYYLSRDTTKSSDDILLTGGRSVPSLAPGVTSTERAQVTVPSSTAKGVYHLLACADGKAVVTETNDTNSCIASGTKVQVFPSP